MSEATPFAYFITFSCYGARLHGSSKGTVDRIHNEFDTPYLDESEPLYLKMKNHMLSSTFLLSDIHRRIVLEQIIKTSEHYKWLLIAAHVRTNHVHIVVRSEAQPEFVMNQVKAYSTRKLNEHFPDHKKQKKWSRHGSTRNLYGQAATHAVVDYVINRQGEPMAFYENIDYFIFDE
jgi:REP element-mobilizing transposase RayT